ncbi:hypothetical protein BOVATA_012850 [Babesia ovata]|uniref:Uncharacterized protein n=1 Tax=Babesia ovata TaxID=189622 RepID=A0A2H6K9W0_9APIC|nr:uncharacterized protein BOVATA_012850 [Babesia ovata]GBE59792.1 hypothetical protein BOVATA_012850 [Babesia ovata]
MALAVTTFVLLGHFYAALVGQAASDGADPPIRCVALSAPDSILNRHLCEKIGLGVCDSAAAVLALSSAIVRDAPNRERCLQTLFGLYAALACPTRSSAEQFIQRVGVDGPVVAYVCKGVCKALWTACSPRAGLPFADLLAEEESKTICKNVALPQSAVQIREARDNQCIGRIITLSEADVAEINWLLGGRVNWHFIKLKGYGKLWAAEISS